MIGCSGSPCGSTEQSAITLMLLRASPGAGKGGLVFLHRNPSGAGEGNRTLVFSLEG